MKPAAFDYHRPATAFEAVSLLAELGDEAKFIAGGQSLMPMLALRLAAFEHLIDISRLSGLEGIEVRGESVWIGAGTRQSAIGRSQTVTESVPLLARATPLIGHFQIRNRGTIGGSIAHADAAAEYPAVAITLDAQIELLSPRGSRTVPAGDFFTGMWSTDMADDELLTGVNFPIWKGRCGFAVDEFARRQGDFAIAGATVAIRIDDDSRIDRCAIGLFGLGPAVTRATAAEQALIGVSADEVDTKEIGELAVSGLTSVPADLHGSAGYRTRVGATRVNRALDRALLEAKNG